jgi:hypothetical protein
MEESKPLGKKHMKMAKKIQQTGEGGRIKNIIRANTLGPVVTGKRSSSNPPL